MFLDLVHLPNYSITIEYDGKGFAGWQFQPNTRTVQSELESALQILNSGKQVRIHGAGRTDAGVHARGQVANFTLELQWDVEELRSAINGNTSEDIHIHSCHLVSDDFHARFSAKRRKYVYRCRINETILDRNFVWRLGWSPQIEALQSCADAVKGDHDFTTFSKWSSEVKTRRCIVYQSKWINDGDFVIYLIEANRFLQHMIRYLVGTMMEVGRGRITEKDFVNLLEACDPKAKIAKAPAQGLYLEEIIY